MISRLCVEPVAQLNQILHCDQYCNVKLFICNIETFLSLRKSDLRLQFVLIGLKIIGAFGKLTLAINLFLNFSVTQERTPKYFNERQEALEISCLHALWNFSEMKAERQLVLREIGLEPFLHSLLKDESNVVYPVENSNLGKINESSAGCLAQYVFVGEKRLRKGLGEFIIIT